MRQAGWAWRLPAPGKLKQEDCPFKESLGKNLFNVGKPGSDNSHGEEQTGTVWACVGPYLAGELLYDLGDVVRPRRRLLQGHHHEELKELLLLQFDEVPLQGLVVGVPLAGLLQLGQALVAICNEVDFRFPASSL